MLEHVTTRAGVDFVRAGSPHIAATITPQHLLLNRGAMFAGGLRPHLYCLPLLKRERTARPWSTRRPREIRASFSARDSAPHARTAKESACGCAGVFSAPAAIELYAQGI